MSRRVPAMLVSPLPAAALALAFAAVASAQGNDAPNVYRCRQPNGAITYQDYACKGGVAVDIKRDAADPRAIERLRRAQAEFDRTMAERRAAESRAAIRHAPIVVPDEGGAPPDAAEPPQYLLYGPIPQTRFMPRERRHERRVVAPERRIPAVIRRPRAS